MLHEFYKGSDKTDTIGNLVPDFSKASNSIDHTIKLIKLGVRREIIPLIVDFLTNMWQRVKYQGTLSNWKSLSCGVLQGTKIGPLAFLAMINDEMDSSEFQQWKYVDDLSIGEVRSSRAPTTIKRRYRPQRMGWSEPSLPEYSWMQTAENLLQMFTAGTICPQPWN